MQPQAQDLPDNTFTLVVKQPPWNSFNAVRLSYNIVFLICDVVTFCPYTRVGHKSTHVLRRDGSGPQGRLCSS